jgi:hypothetical protein
MTPVFSLAWIAKAERAAVNWRLGQVPPRGGVCFVDDRTFDLGADEGCAFDLVARTMLAGDYYPPDAVKFSGRFRDEDRPLQAGDRAFQQAPLWPFSFIKLLSCVEIFVAERTETRASVGYVTTEMHHGRGEWRADLSRESQRLILRVQSVALPSSVWFWIGLPVARALQLRARRRGVENLIARAQEAPSS